MEKTKLTTKEVIFILNSVGYQGRPQMPNCDLSNLNLSNLSFFNANLRGADFSGCELTGCDFRQASVEGATFTGSTWPQAMLEGHAIGFVPPFTPPADNTASAHATH